MNPVHYRTPSTPQNSPEAIRGATRVVPTYDPDADESESEEELVQKPVQSPPIKIPRPKDTASQWSNQHFGD